MKQSLYIPLLLLLTVNVIQPCNITIQEISTSPQQKNIMLQVSLDSCTQILKQTLSISLDTPQASYGEISITPAASKKYLPAFSDLKDVLEKEVTINVPVKVSTDQPVQANLHVSFLLLPENNIIEKITPLSFNQTEQSPNEQLARETVGYNSSTDIPVKKTFTESIQHLVQTSNNIWIRLLFAFLLGLLLSLTPCIYPMIPITIGILHHNEKRSLLYNFLGSLSYAFGMSTTFALLGLLAAFAGASFGSLLSQPIFVGILVLFIGYMSLTMIGIIDLRIPSFLQRSTQLSSTFGPFGSAFIFGVISGSVASPCVSPGLALLLTIVATMGNVFAGFLLLFLFGIGLSTPLIVIGTFSSSMTMLPRAGQWMVEVKKALGFFMLATCLYYLNNILPTTVTAWVIVAFLLFAALFYIIDAQKDFDTKTKTIKSLLGIMLLALTVVMGSKTFDQMNSKTPELDQQGVIWAENYDDALHAAQAENKLILLDFWANHCTICKAIDKKIFHKDIVWSALQDKIIFIKVDCTNNSNPEAARLKEQFKVYAQPAILIINPTHEEVMKKWSSEPYSMTPDNFVKAVQNIQ